jgi:hypothetical protein
MLLLAILCICGDQRYSGDVAPRPSTLGVVELQELDRKPNDIETRGSILVFE